MAIAIICPARIPPPPGEGNRLLAVEGALSKKRAAAPFNCLAGAQNRLRRYRGFACGGPLRLALRATSAERGGILF
jgi:hypothetical protein